MIGLNYNHFNFSNRLLNHQIWIPGAFLDSFKTKFEWNFYNLERNPRIVGAYMRCFLLRRITKDYESMPQQIAALLEARGY